MSVLPISPNIINVSIEAAPSAASTPNVNALALLTNEVPNNINPYGIYVSPSQVEADYGTNSVTFAMANAIFAQVPNILSGDGQLIIAPLLNSVSATNGYFTTTNISANLATLIGVTNGDLKVTLNGVALNLTNLNFTGCATLADIAQVIQAKLQNVVVTNVGNTIIFASKKVGTISTVALATYAGGGQDISGVGYLNQAAGAATAGADSSGETLVAAISRVLPQVFFAGVMTNLNLEDAVIETAAAAIQAQDMLGFFHFSSTEDIAGVITTISSATETKSRCLLYTQGSQAGANLMKAAYASRGMSTDFTGSDTASTMNLKTLATITPDLGITQTDLENANTAGADVYPSFQGEASVYSSQGNDFFDNPYADLALKFALVTAGFNYLRTTNTKVPQTEPGMDGLKSAYIGVMSQFVINGELAPGSWDSSETFGDPAIFNQNITSFGYYVYSLPVAQQNVSDRNARKAPLVQIAAKRAGAIQQSNVLVAVNN